VHHDRLSWQQDNYGSASQQPVISLTPTLLMKTTLSLLARMIVELQPCLERFMAALDWCRLRGAYAWAASK
jgi:hypothetical protein